MEYLKDIINKLGNVLLIIVLILFGLIHLKHDELVIKHNLIQFGQQLVSYE